jgi:hypothetical protein
MCQLNEIQKLTDDINESMQVQFFFIIYSFFQSVLQADIAECSEGDVALSDLDQVRYFNKRRLIR